MEIAEWLTAEEVAPILGIGAKNVYRMSAPAWPEDKRIPCYRLGPRGGKLRFKRAEIEAYVESLRPHPEPTHRPLRLLEPRVGPKRPRP